MRYWLAGFVMAPVVFAAAPDIDSISPRALRSGVTTEITLSGTDLGDAKQLWTSFPARVEWLGDGKFRVTTDGPTGVGALRAFGSNGVSNLGFVLVDPSSTVVETVTNKTKASAQQIEVGGAVEGRCEELSYDWFKFQAAKGQRVSVETAAACLGSKLDSMLRIVNAAGREVARNDDAPGWSGDSLVNFIAPETGDYFIELRDVNYGGGSTFFYRLRVGNAPITTRAFAKAVGGAGREIFEKEPNDSAPKATRVSLADTIHGRFDKANDRDCYEFSARKGDRMEFRAAARRLGSPCDVVLQLDSADGKKLARSNPSAADEGVLTYLFPSNGMCRLRVEEATGAFGSNMVYRITAQPAAGFTLTLDTDRVNAAPGKSFELKVTATRGDFKGAIDLAVGGLADSLVLTNNVIAEGKSNTTMRVTAPEALTPGTWQPISVTGTVRRDGKEVQVRASTAPALRRQLPLLLYAPPEFDGVMALGVTSAR